MNDDTTKLCELLDDYLDDEMPADARLAFDGHLNRCAACREAVEEQRWIDSLLRSDAAAEIEAPALVLRPKSRRGRWLVAAAAAAVAAWLLLPLPRREGTGEGFPTVAEGTGVKSEANVGNPSPSPSLPGRGISEPAAKFVSSGSAIAIPVASTDPQVTIVKLYPTLTASRRWARETALRHDGLSPNGG